MGNIRLLQLLDWLYSIEHSLSLSLVDSGLTLAQFRMLRIIETSPGISVSEISRKLNIAKPTASIQIQELIRIGVIAMENDPADKRGKKVYISPKGENRMKNAYENLSVMEKKFSAKTIADVLKKIQKKC